MQWISFNPLRQAICRLTEVKVMMTLMLEGFDVNKTTSLQMGSQGTKCPPKSALVLVSVKFTGARQEKPRLLMGELQLKYDSVPDT